MTLETESPGPTKDDKSPTLLERLPMPAALEKAEIWFDDDELKAFRNARKVRAEYALLPIFCFIPLLYLETTLGLNSFAMWRMLVSTCLFWYVSSMLVPLAFGLKAFSLLEAGDPAGALKACESSNKITRYLGPMGAVYHSFFIDQVRGIASAMRGRIVDGQVILAQWIYCPENLLEDSLMQTTFGALYSYVGRIDLAEKIYSARYETSRKTFTSKIGKAVAAANMGWVHFLMRDYEASKRYSTEAVSYFANNTSDDWTWIKIGVWTNLSRACIRLGEFHEAEKLVTDAWNLFSKQTRHPGIRAGEINLSFAELRFVQGRFDEALLYASSATECYQASLAPGNASVIYSMRFKAQILRTLGNLEEASRLDAQAELDEHALREDNEMRLDELRMRLLSGPNGLLVPSPQ